MLCSQEEGVKALKEGRLTTLGGRVKGGLVVVSGRVPEEDLGPILKKMILMKFKAINWRIEFWMMRYRCLPSCLGRRG